MLLVLYVLYWRCKQKMFVGHCSLHLIFFSSFKLIFHSTKYWVSAVLVSNSIFVLTETQTNYTIVLLFKHIFYFLNLSVFPLRFIHLIDFNLTFAFELSNKLKKIHILDCPIAIDKRLSINTSGCNMDRATAIHYGTK